MIVDWPIELLPFFFDQIVENSTAARVDHSIRGCHVRLYRMRVAAFLELFLYKVPVSTSW